MKKRLTTLKLAASMLAIALLVPMANATDVAKANNTDNLDQGTSWVGGTGPGTGDVALWDSTVTAANSTLLGSDLSWLGIRIADPTGNVTIDGGNSLTLGSSGINATSLSGSKEFHLFNSKVILGASQEWTFSGWNNAEVGNTTADEIDTAGNTLTVRNSASIFKSKITGSGGLTKRGSGQIQLLGTSTYTGTTDIQGGTLMIGNGWGAGSLADASTITGSGSGTLQLNKKNGNSYIMRNTIGGAIKVNVHTGDIRLTATSGYTGATTIDAGATLTVNGTVTNTIITVNGADALLGGAGRVGEVNFGVNGGKLAPGNTLDGYGTLDTGDVDLSSAGTVTLELVLGGTTGGLNFDRLRVAGSVDLSGQELGLSLASGYTPDVGDAFGIIDNDAADAVSGTFSGLSEGSTFTLGSTEFSISYVGGDGNDVVVTTIPEPAILGLIAASGAGLVFLRRLMM